MRATEFRKLIQEEVRKVLKEEKPTNDMVKNYWSIMVENQPEDVVKILVGLTNGDLPFEKFSLDTANDVYDSFKDESYDDEDEELDESKLKEEESNEVLTQEDFNVLRTKGFAINFAKPEHNLFWIERRYRAPRADFKYLENLLNKKNIPFEIEMFSTDGRGAKQKMVWIDTKYTNASREDNPGEI